MTISAIIAEIADERLRQIQEEGWTPEHDDEHREGDLARAAAAYAYAASLPDYLGWYKAALSSVSVPGLLRHLWPWEPKWWKPKGCRRDLVRAAALIVAEIERLDRAAAREAADG